MAVLTQLHIDPGAAQHGFDFASDLLGVLQRAWRMPSDPLTDFPMQFALQFGLEISQQLTDIARQVRYPRSLARIGRVEPQPDAVITIASAPASTCGHQASILRRMSSRPPS
jgi:hypothetical protein